jgi:hypothetical protein
LKNLNFTLESERRILQGLVRHRCRGPRHSRWKQFVWQSLAPKPPRSQDQVNRLPLPHQEGFSLKQTDVQKEVQAHLLLHQAELTYINFVYFF